MIINITLTEEQKQQAARELDLNTLLRIVLTKTMVNEDTMEIASKIHEYLKNKGRKEIKQEQQEVIEVEQQEATTPAESTRKPINHLDLLNKYPPTKKPKYNKSIKTRCGDNVKFKSGKLGGNEVLTGIIEKKEPDSYAGCLMYTIAEENGNKHYVSNSEILEVIK